MAETLSFTYTYGSTASSSNSTTTAVVPAGEVIITSSLVLPSQTVPFAQPDSCTTAPTIVCENLDAGVTCTGVASVEKGGKATTTIDDGCFPEGYRDVFIDRDGVYRDIRALAYPGTACPTSWTVACSTSMPDLPTSSFPLSIASQSWCCPPGWGCLTAGPRLCQSFAQTRTSVLVSGSDSTVDFSVFMVHTPVFPLQADLSSTPTATSSAPPQVGGSGGLGAGAIVGIVFGVVVFVALLAVAWYLWWYMKRKREEAGGVVELEMNGLDGKGKDKRYRDNVSPSGGAEAGPSSSGASGPGTGTGMDEGGSGGGSGSGRGVKIAGDVAARYA